MVFHWSLSDSKSPQVSRTRLSILAVLNNAVVWIVSIRSPNSKSSSPFNNPLVTVPQVPITIGIIFTLMFYVLFCFIINIQSLHLFTSASADGFSRRSEWQQVSSSLLVIIYFLKVFHWVTASFLKFPGLFSVFWLFSIV